MPGNEEADRSLAMADEALARFDVEAGVAHLSAAVRRLTEDRECRAAAMACVRLGDVLINFMGNATAGKAWFLRARRLVEDEPPCLEQGYVAVAAMGCDVDDPVELLAAAELALDLARRFGDVNLETKALADAGLAHVQAGRVDEGMALMDEAMAAAPGSQVAHGALGCDVSLNDLCDRPPRALAEGEVLDLGGKRVRQISTPHVPHGWEAQVLFEETTGTLLCGDLFSQVGRPTALTEADVVEPALVAENTFHATCMAPHTAATLRMLGDLQPTTLAIMHGSSFRGDGHRALYDLAGAYERLALAA